MSILQRFKKASESQKPRLPQVLRAMQLLLVQQQETDLERDHNLDWEYEHMNDSVYYAKRLAATRKMNADFAACAVAAQNIGRITTGKSEGHAEAGYELAKRFFLGLGCFTITEAEQLASAVRNHSNKDRIDTPLDELAKDVDIYVRYVHGSEFSTQHELRRLSALRLEFQKKINK
jgi:uncharacterized protein